MRGLAGLGLIGLLITGGIWIKNEAFGSDHKVCEEFQSFEAALVSGEMNSYNQDAYDFEFDQVKDRELADHVRAMKTTAEAWEGVDQTRVPEEARRVALGAFVGALERCEELGL